MMSRVFPLSLRLAVVLALAAALAPVAVGAETVVEARQRLMVSMIKATKVPRAMVAGETAFDVGAVDEAVKQVLEATALMPKLFPDGSAGGPSAALPAIFQNRADFEGRLLDLEKASVQLAFAARQGKDEMAYAFHEYEAVCEGCHAKYRRPD
ncbi:hypothetical protein GCM10007904_11850 [Oharaeibacter diazotrophicus]|nr:hypothetical protein GCM10007904_11850 [Oharaeibacter diazotrophicus]